MTTIAFDGRYLAADTLGVRGGNRSELPGCKIEVRDGYSFATGGYWGHYRSQLIAWHVAGHDPRSCPGAGVEGAVLVLSPQRELFVFTHEAPFPDPEVAPFALGTGGDIALGAMGAGLTAMEAVALAARWDLKTGGPIDFIDFEHIDKGVQRWDGVMPSAKYPMPVNVSLEDDPLSWKDDGTTGKMEFEKVEIPKPVVTAIGATCRGSYVLGTACRQCERCLVEWQGMQKRGQDDDFAVSLLPKSFKVAGNGRTARRVPETMLCDDPDEPDPNPERSQRIVAELFHKVPETRQTCVHGMKPDTCSTCRANRTANLYPV